MVVNKPMIGVAAAVVVVAGAVGFYFHSHRAPPPSVPTAPAPVAGEAAPSVAHPLPEASPEAAAAAPLPALNDSDTSLLESLAQLAGAAAVKDYLQPESVVRHLVVTIDNLPRQKVASCRW